MLRVYTEQQRQAFRDRMIAAKEAKKLVAEEKVDEKTTITLNFTKPIEVGINGTMYVGKQIEVENMKLAAEIVRIAKNAYGWDILG